MENGCEVWLKRSSPDEAEALASMIAPLLDRDALELEQALRAGPVQAARDLPLSEASQLAEVLLGFGASAEVRTRRSDSQRPQPITRGTQPFSAEALRASLAERGDAPLSDPFQPRMSVASTPPVMAFSAEEIPDERVRRAEVTNEPTQVNQFDNELIQAAIAAAEAAELEKHRAVEAERRRSAEAAELARRRSAEEAEKRRSGETFEPRAEAEVRRPPTQPGAPVEAAAPRVSQPLPGLSAERRTDTPAPIVTTGEQALKGRMTLPKSMQSSQELPPWFPKVSLRPEPPPRPSRTPMVLFSVGVVTVVVAVLFVVFQR